MRRSAGVLATCLAVGSVLAVVLTGPGSVAVAHPLLQVRSHPRMDNGKPLPHPAGATEVTFDEERAEAADNTGSSDTPPDGTATALGCANRGSLTNRRVNQDCTARRQAEEQITVNPLDASNVIAGQNDSRVGFNHCGFDYSLDGATTWGDDQPGFFQHLNPGTNHSYDAASDPAVTVSGDGTAWYSCVVFDVNTNATGLFVVPSTPALKGAAYANVAAGASSYVVAEADDGKVFYDKEFIAADPRPGHKEVYVTFTLFNSDPSCGTQNNRSGYCSSPIYYSKWNGSAWSAPVNVSGRSPLCVGGNTFTKKESADACNFDQGSMPVVNPADGSVYVTWNNGNTPTFVNQTLGRRIDANGTMGPVVKVGVDDETNVALCELGRGPEECVDSLNVRTNDFPAVAVDPADTNHLVAVWQDSRLSPAPGGVGAGDYGVVVSESDDGGASWSDASGGGTYLKGAAGEAYFEPSVAVTQVGTVAVSYYRANPHAATDGMGTFGYGMQVRHVPSTTFTGYTPVSDSQSNPSPEANAIQRGFLGDYSSIAASTAPGSDVVYPCWSDTRNTGELGPDEDVFVATIPLS